MSTTIETEVCKPALPPVLAVGQELVTYFTELEIQDRIAAMAAEINNCYSNVNELTLVVVMNGAFMFASDLMKQLSMPCNVEFIRLASYGNSTQSSGSVKAVDLSLPDLGGKHVLIVEDIIDTGLTLHFFKEYLSSLHKTQSLKVAVLLDKTEKRQKQIMTDFVGFTVGNEFLVGYGLDFAGYCRNLPFIGAVHKA
ncbi:MAG: hypoxanthine phosphoribosyltransferase [Cyanobacteria bacterium P01_H01_bin.74]